MHGGGQKKKRRRKMVNDVPKVAPTGRYNCKQAAQLLGISTKTLLAHTKANYIQCGYHQCNGRKFYLGSEIVRYWGGEYA